MANPLRSAAIISKDNDAAADEVSVRTANLFSRSGIEISLVAPLAAKGFETVESPVRPKKSGIDAVIVVGGDGTILSTARQLDDGTPILGINVGGRGILAEILPSKISEALESIKAMRFHIETRFRLAARDGRRRCPPALNEVYICRLRRIRTPRYSIEIGGGRILQRMDGLMLSTPAGSTGHSLSFGSPVISDSLDAILLTPIAPISRMPPIVLHLAEISVTSDEDSSLLIDGQIDFRVNANEKIRIVRHATDAAFIRFSEPSFRQLGRLGF